MCRSRVFRTPVPDQQLLHSPPLDHHPLAHVERRMAFLHVDKAAEPWARYAGHGSAGRRTAQADAPQGLASSCS